MSGLDGLGWPNPEDEPKSKKIMNSQLEIKLAPTPETDQCVKANKHLRFLQEDHYMGNSKTTYENPIVFLSRKLERERNEAREGWADEIRKGQAELRNAERLYNEAIRERDEAQERADTMFVKHAEILDQARRERNEWKAKYIQQNKDLGCEMMDPNGTIWDYAKKVQRELTVVTKQRDQLEGRLRVELGGHPESELWGDTGLIAATMRCVDALDSVTEQRDRLSKHLNVLAYWRDISECDCHNPLPNGGCLRCDLDKVFNSNQ